MSNFFDQFLNLVFPPKCEVCRAYNQEPICKACLDQVKFIKPVLGVYAVSDYEGIMRQAIVRFKFKKRQKLSEPLGMVMLHYLNRFPGMNLHEIDMIMPVPLHKKKTKKRGFNQVELLARHVSHYHGIPLEAACLVRTRVTKAQYELSREERIKNVKSAFSLIDPEKIIGKNILLMDDIYTTGATISECSRVLKQGGAKRVEVLALARAVDDRPKL